MRGTCRTWPALLPLALATVACGAPEERLPGEEDVMTRMEAATNRTALEANGSVESRIEPRMETQVMGDGPRLVLIGGGLTGWASWAPHAEQLAATRTVARLQLLGVGFGLKDRPLPRGYSVGLESRALAAALDALGWTEPVDLVAWSYGALVTLDFALGQPERIRTLTLIEPPAVWVLPDHGRGDPDVEALRDLAKTASDDVSAADLELFLRTVAIVPPDADPRELPQWPLWLEHRRSLRIGLAPLVHRDDPARLHAFDRPVLLVSGTGTSPFLRRIHDTLAASLPAARTLEMPAGHAPQLVSPDRFLADVASFQAARR
jgi:pimeloyl-ACP methyl ester carboxylesterase